MNLSRICLLALVCAGPCVGQEGLMPPYEIAPTIAKLPEVSDFEGKWLRSDGTYELNVENVTGELTVQYHNPRPINVESASFDAATGEPILTVVLRDEGYPGSTYNLVYMAERGILYGNYSRPGSEPSVVYFVRDSAK